MTKKKIIKKTLIKKIPIETERKFLLRRLPKKILKDFKHDILHITQYYFNINGKFERFRISTNQKNGITKYIHTIKKYISLGSNHEDEHGIKKVSFKKLYDEHKDNCLVIEKTRFVIKYKKFKFEIDLYHGLNLVTLEVELPHLNTSFEYPLGLAEEIVYELTGIEQFSNKNLAFKNKNYVIHFKNHR